MFGSTKKTGSPVGTDNTFSFLRDNLLEIRVD